MHYDCFRYMNLCESPWTSPFLIFESKVATTIKPLFCISFFAPFKKKIKLTQIQYIHKRDNDEEALWCYPFIIQLGRCVFNINVPSAISGVSAESPLHCYEELYIYITFWSGQWTPGQSMYFFSSHNEKCTMFLMHDGYNNIIKHIDHQTNSCRNKTQSNSLRTWLSWEINTQTVKQTHIAQHTIRL